MYEQNNNQQNNGQNIQFNPAPQQVNNMNPPQMSPQNTEETEILGFNTNNYTNNNQPSITNIPPQNSNINQQISNNTNEKADENKNEKGGCLKQLILFIFLAALIAFVFFLPDISKFLKNGKNNSTTNDIWTGTLECTTEQSNDTSIISYTMKFDYIDNKLKTSTMTITLQDESDENINNKTLECQNISKISQEITGITVMCNPSANLLITTEIYEHEVIDKNKLSKFTESGGKYPEFDYQDDINDIKRKMKKNGYICKDK